MAARQGSRRGCTVGPRRRLSNDGLCHIDSVHPLSHGVAVTAPPTQGSHSQSGQAPTSGGSTLPQSWQKPRQLPLMRGPRSVVCAYFDSLFPSGVCDGQTAFSNRRTGRNCEKLRIFRHRTGKTASENRFHKMKNLKIILFPPFSP